MSERLSHDQKRALACLRNEGGPVCEDTLWMEGLNMPRLTMLSLERRGLVTRGPHLNEYRGYEWSLRGGAV